jgi:hypothetical protein
MALPRRGIVDVDEELAMSRASDVSWEVSLITM